MAELEWRVLPTIVDETKPYWEACRRHELVVQRCRRCGSFQHYPRPFCAECHAQEMDWHKSSGQGNVYTFSIAYRAQSAAFSHRTPYVIAYVELSEGVRMLTNILCERLEEVHVGMPVRVVFEDVDGEITIPCFRPVSEMERS